MHGFHARIIHDRRELLFHAVLDLSKFFIHIGWLNTKLHLILGTQNTGERNLRRDELFQRRRFDAVFFQQGVHSGGICLEAFGHAFHLS